MTRYAVAQMASERGNVDNNIANHIRFIEKAAELNIDYIVFPELSLTGYELDLAKELAFVESDSRLAPLIDACVRTGVAVGVGLPLKGENAPYIGLAIIDKSGLVTHYKKMHLHDGEEAYVSSGESYSIMSQFSLPVANAICADTINPQHAIGCADLAAQLYIAGVLVTPGGYDKDASIWAKSSQDNQLVVMVANYNQPSGGLEAAGKSAVWVNGELLAQASTTDDCIVVAENRGHFWSASVSVI